MHNYLFIQSNEMMSLEKYKIKRRHQINFYKKSEIKAPAIGIQFNHGDVQLEPNYFKKQRSSSSFLLT